MKTIARVFFTLLFISFPGYTRAGEKYKLLEPQCIETKNYYFISLLEHLPEAKEFVCKDPVLSRIGKEKEKRLIRAETPEEIISGFKFSQEEIGKIGQRLYKLYEAGNILEKIMKNHLLPSGCYSLLEKGFSGKDLLKKIWEQDAEGMNRAVNIYANGERPNYPEIDSVSFNVKSDYFKKEILGACKQNIELETCKDSLFFSVPLAAIKTVLDMNDRMRACDFEPLDRGENRISYGQIAETDWNRYPYTSILVLGAGPESPGQKISPEGRLRASYAALLYKKGEAPFIIVSGGKVHPYHTPYCEAYEMKKYLMEKWDVPESAIIIEPHARHTTTNVRNAARIMIREGFPENKPALITSSKSHIDYVGSRESFGKRCENELKTIPYRLGKRISERAIEFYPEESALQINPGEPLDP